MTHWLAIYAFLALVTAWLLDPPRWRAIAWPVVLAVYLHRGPRA